MKNQQLPLLLILTISLLFACKKPTNDHMVSDDIAEGILVEQLDSMFAEQLFFINDSVGFALESRIDHATNRRKLFLTTDGMKTWEDRSVPFDRSIVSFQVFSKDFICARLSQNRYAYSRNMGKDWTVLPITVSNKDVYDMALYDLKMLNELEGYCCGRVIDMATYKDSVGQILKTSNGGQSWELVKAISNKSYITSYSIGIVSASTVLVSATKGNGISEPFFGIFYTSNDHGNNWTEQTLNPKEYSSCQFQYNRSGFANYAVGVAKKDSNKTYAPFSYLLRLTNNGPMFDTIRTFDVRENKYLDKIHQWSMQIGLLSSANKLYYSTNGFTYDRYIRNVDEGSAYPASYWMFSEKNFIVAYSNGKIIRYQL